MTTYILQMLDDEHLVMAQITDLHLLIGDSIFEIPITCQKQTENQMHILGVKV